LPGAQSQLMVNIPAYAIGFINKQIVALPGFRVLRIIVAFELDNAAISKLKYPVGFIKIFHRVL